MLRFQLLGPVEVHTDGGPVPLRGPKQRTLLALLLLNAGSVVSRARLAEGIWGDEPPPGAGHALDTQVSALRGALAAAGGPRIERRPPGYLLTIDGDGLDVTRFDTLAGHGRALIVVGDLDGGVAKLREALDLWRGPALADIQAAPFAFAAATTLEDRRIDVVEDLAEAELARGRGAELVTDLEAGLAEHPFRERLVCALATALYRTGRQTRALEVIASARRRFAAELGLAPGAAVLTLEQRILVHDPSLRIEPVTSQAPPPAAPEKRPRLRAGWRAAVGAALLLVGALVVLEMSGSASNTGGKPAAEAASTLAPGGLNGFDVVSGSAQGTQELAAVPSAVVAGRRGLWVAEPSQNTVELIDPDGGEAALARLPIAGSPGALAVGDDAIWVACTLSGAVQRIDQETNEVTQTIEVGGAPVALAFGAGRLWVADQNGSRLLAVDPETGETSGQVALPSRPTALDADTSGVWIASHDAGTVTRVDPDAMAVIATVRVGGGPTALASGAGSVWVANNEDSTVSRLNTSTGRVAATVPVDSGPAALAYAGGALWVAGEHAGTVTRLDPATNTVDDELPTAGGPVVLAVDGTSVWAGTQPVTEARGGTLTMIGDAAPSTVDPGYQILLPPPQLLGLVHDGLVTLEQSSGPRGLQLVPDLAVSLPSPADSATSYTFQLRPGITYSTGMPVKASDFRRGIERLFRGSSPGTGYYSGLVGARRCLAQPTRCRLHDGVEVNDDTGTVTFHLTSPDPNFLFRLTAMTHTAPVPPGTSARDNEMRPIPGTGPYRIVKATAEEIRLERNPLFKEWSYAAQPDGNPDVIVWRFGVDPADQVQAIRSGEADWMSGIPGIPAELWSGVRNHDNARLHVNDVPDTEFMVLRTREAPFDNVLARQALNLAIDRSEVVNAFGGEEQATPTCQMLPPTDTAYTPFCPYTRDPGRDGTWIAPDLPKARALVDRSGSRGATVTVLGFSDEPPTGTIAHLTAQALRRIGYRVDLTVTTRPELESMPPAAQEAFDIGPYAWWADYPSPSAFFETMLLCDAPLMHGRICKPELDRRIAAVLKREATGRGDVDRLWTAIDRRATELALTVPLVNPRSVELTSTRLSGYQYNPQWGFLPALASVS